MTKNSENVQKRKEKKLQELAKALKENMKRRREQRKNQEIFQSES